MNAFHIASFAPSKAKGREKVTAEAFDLYCTAISALQWRKNGGNIVLCCDRPYAEFYKKTGFSGVWDDIIINVDDDLEKIDPKMFWAGGKLLALREMKAPTVMLDTDFIVWENPAFGEEIIAAHREDLSREIYPPLDFFEVENHVLPDFSEEALPLNTAFLYLPDGDFKEFYTSQAIAFMKAAKPCDDFLRYMVFAEQRLLAMCADFTKTPVRTLLEKDRLFVPQSRYTHLWGAKQAMRDDPRLKKDFISRCERRILSDFPEYSYLVEIVANTAEN